jgi:hypothetical protein
MITEEFLCRYPGKQATLIRFDIDDLEAVRLVSGPTCGYGGGTVADVYRSDDLRLCRVSNHGGIHG